MEIKKDADQHKGQKEKEKYEKPQITKYSRTRRINMVAAATLKATSL